MNALPLPIEARGLKKAYSARFGGKTILALDGLDLDVRPGELFGLLGPERRRQDDDGQDPARPDAADLRRGPALRDSRPRSREPPPRRVPARGAPLPRLPHRARDAGDLRAHVGRRPARLCARRIRPASRARGARRVEGRARQEVLQGHDAAARPRGGARPRARRPPPRRADGRRRPGRPPRDPRPPARRGVARARHPRQLAPPLRDRAAPATASRSCARARSSRRGRSRS